MLTPKLSIQQRSQVVLETERLVDQVHKHYSLKPKTVSISFDVKGSAWGYFVIQRRDYYIRYNPFLFARYFDDGIKDTIPHEVAHYAVARTNPRRRCKPHGSEWRNVMSLFKIHNPKATHCADISGIPCRRQRRFPYACRCGKVELSTTRHKRVLYEGAKYKCRKCGEVLVQQPTYPAI